MILILNDKILSSSATIDDIYNVLDKLMYNYNVIVLENETTGNYIQLLCSKYSGIAEIRIYNDNGFVHLRAYSKINFKEELVKLKTPNFVMEVQNKYVLSMMILKRLMIDFLNQEEPSKRINWGIMTDEFK